MKLLPVFEYLGIADHAVIAAGRQDVDHIAQRILSTKKAEDISPTLRNLKQLDAGHAHRWVGHWEMLRFIATGWLQATPKL